VSRLVQTVLEHSFRTRLADGRKFFVFPASVAPVKCAIVTIRHAREGDQMNSIAQRLKKDMLLECISFQSDLGGNLIGKKYKDADEARIPFTIAIDDQSLNSDDVTIRNRDTLNQIRVPVDLATGQLLCFFNNSCSHQLIQKF